MLKARYIVLFFLLLSSLSWSQSSNLRRKELVFTGDTIRIDTLSIYTPSFVVLCNGKPLSKDRYHLDAASATFFLHSPCDTNLVFIYRVFSHDFSASYSAYDTLMVFKVEGDNNRNVYMQSAKQTATDIFGNSSIKKSGSMSRGLTFGNAQDMGVNSSLNLELSGEIAPNLKVLAAVTDNNLPIQPDGNTSKLQEFDQVFIQLYNDRLKLIAGDFWINKPTGYFMNYKKRGQGLTLQYDFRNEKKIGWQTQVSGAMSKGKFNRQVIQGVEGNQGPYRLLGADNEPFIIILAGTERVYIDGRLLARGQENDYVINYNTSEITFTARQQITKDTRIVVEFQYSDQNYARTLIQTANEYSGAKFDFWLNGYSEQDAKNQTIQQDLSQREKMLLANLGDSIQFAYSYKIDSIGYLDNQVMYRLVDTLGYDSVLVHSVNPNLAVYRTTFQLVGTNRGDYVLQEYIAVGKVYKWVEPVNGVPQGNYIPARLIITPKQRQMVTSGARYRFTDRFAIETELAYTNNNINTFSKKDKKDDGGLGVRVKLNGNFDLKKKDSIVNWTVDTKVDFEVLDKNFNPIELYRSVEFDRDWNTRNKGYAGNQISTIAGANFKHKKRGNLNVEAQNYQIGSFYKGYKGRLSGEWAQNGFKAYWDGSFLGSFASESSTYLRHKIDVSKSFKWFKVGFKDDQERNVFLDEQRNLKANAYQFYDYQFYVENPDSLKTKFRVFFRERYDGVSNENKIEHAAKAQSLGGELKLLNIKNQRLNVLASYRSLKIADNNLINQKPENTLLSRIDYEFKLFKSAIQWNTFYEIGSGLEQRKEFLYVQVNTGQGIYTWIDYNGDGIKDLNEFEVAQYADQAAYIRVFTPSNQYVKTYSNEFNQSLSWRPERIWNKKKGFLGVLAKLSTQTRFRVNRKTSDFNGFNSFNPFYGRVQDTSLISTNYNFRNTVYINRTSTIFSLDWSIQNTRSKTLLASGFDSRVQFYHEMNGRWNITKKFILEIASQIGDNSSYADYTIGRNFEIKYFFIKPSFSYQPNTAFRITLLGRYQEKHNLPELGGQNAFISDLGVNIKFNQAQKGSLQAEFKLVSIVYDGIQNSALGYEMLESLRPGINYTWNLGYQRMLSKNLQMSLQYLGRKSEGNKVIHTAGMEVRAYF